MRYGVRGCSASASTARRSGRRPPACGHHPLLVLSRAARDRAQSGNSRIGRHRATTQASVCFCVLRCGRPTWVPEPQAPKLADRIVVRKSKRTLELLHDGALFESFPIALGREPRGSKQEEGDGRTPEGVYLIDGRSMQTRYTRALHISYPDGNDRDRARAMKAEPGGAIFIHGLPSDYGPFDPPQW